jgi:hypothetical protein
MADRDAPLDGEVLGDVGGDRLRMQPPPVAVAVGGRADRADVELAAEPQPPRPVIGIDRSHRIARYCHRCPYRSQLVRLGVAGYAILYQERRNYKNARKIY